MGARQLVPLLAGALAVIGGCRSTATEPVPPEPTPRPLPAEVLLTCRFTGGDPRVDETLTVRRDGVLSLRAAGASEPVETRVEPEKLRGLRHLLASPEVAALDDDYTERMSPEARPAELTITAPNSSASSRVIKTKAFGEHPPALDALIREVAPLMRRAQQAARRQTDAGS